MAPHCAARKRAALLLWPLVFSLLSWKALEAKSWVTIQRKSRITRQATPAFEGKVHVTLGPYSNKAIVIERVPRPFVSDAIVTTAFEKRKAKTSNFVRVDFTGSGARLGHTVLVDMEAKYGAGHREKGATIPGTKMIGFQLELKEDQPEPWKQFVAAITSRGMGQMEQKTFPVSFPQDYRKAEFAGVTADFTVLVREIGELRPVAPDLRPLAEQLQEMEAELNAQAQQKSEEVIDAGLRESLLSSSFVDTESKTKSVSWAKFGPESERAMKWNFILEELARVEGVGFADTLPFLRSQADVRYL